MRFERLLRAIASTRSAVNEVALMVRPDGTTEWHCETDLGPITVAPRKPEWPIKLLSAMTERVSTTTLGSARFCRAARFAVSEKSNRRLGGTRHCW